MFCMRTLKLGARSLDRVLAGSCAGGVWNLRPKATDVRPVLEETTANL